MPSIRGFLRRALDHSPGDSACSCTTEATIDALTVDASACPADGDLAHEPACRRRVVETLRRYPRDEILVVTGGCERWYTPEAVALLGAAARFAESVVHHDDRLADRGIAAREPSTNPVPGRYSNGVSVDVTPSYLPVTEVTPRIADVDAALPSAGRAEREPVHGSFE